MLGILLLIIEEEGKKNSEECFCSFCHFLFALFLSIPVSAPIYANILFICLIIDHYSLRDSRQNRSLSVIFLDNGQSSASNEKKITAQDVPRLPREVTPFAPFMQVAEMDQRGPLFQGPGAKRDTGRYKIRSSDDDTVKKAKKFAMEQSVKYVMFRQQQQQQRSQLELIKKQQALLLMCR